MLVYSQSLIKKLGTNLCHHILKDNVCRANGILLLESANDYNPEFLCIANPAICRQILSEDKLSSVLSYNSYDNLSDTMSNNSSKTPSVDLSTKSQHDLSGYLVCAGDSADLHNIIPDNHISFFITDLEMIPLANLLNKFFMDHSGQGTKDNSFQTLFSKIISSSTDSDDSLMLALKNLPEPPMKNLRLILVRSEIFVGNDVENALYSLLNPIKLFFPGAHIALMPDEIVVLISSEIQYCPIEFSKDSFEKLLSDNKAIAMIGNSFTSINAMRVMYSQTRRMFPIALAVKLPGEKKCMTFARYTQYNVIDICAKTIPELLRGGDIIFLCHPGVLALTKYDRAYGTNLRDVMFHYLMNDRNMTQTSKVLFMHRNTLIYKIHKIEEILGESMDDPYLRHNLVFSCLLLRYRENYQKEGIVLTSFEPSKK